MCIFSQPINRVADTRIFARPTSGLDQYLVYQMIYESETPNAMILPIPVDLTQSDLPCEFINLEQYPGFFDDLHKGFPVLPSRGISIGCSAEELGPKSDYLEVSKVGSYIASFVPTQKDFSRLDPQFVLPASTWKKIPRYQKFSFAVFQLQSGFREVHPMAMKFRRKNRKVFFPTVHIHDGKVHKKEYFDHQLYVQHAGLDSRCGSYQGPGEPRQSETWFRSSDTVDAICKVSKSKGVLLPDLLVHRKQLHGELPNVDTVEEIAGDEEVKSFNSNHLISWSPWLAVPATIGWLFYRRNVVKNRNKESGQDSTGT